MMQTNNNIKSHSALVERADGSHHHIIATGNSNIKANLVSSFHNNLIGISPIINQSAVGIINDNVMTLVKYQKKYFVFFEVFR